VSDELVVGHHGAAGALKIADEILSVYTASHADVLDVPFLAPERFRQRLVDLYAPLPDFELITGRVGAELVGYAFGSPRHESAATWEEVHRVLPDIPVRPDPIYIFREFAVRPECQRQGYGRRLHDALLGTRPEPLAHLLVRRDNARARTTYLSWNWRLAGTSQPFPDSPLCDVMVHPLPL
jgi:ribosomal protein S18 acetylase RimI-like enzyme